MKSYLVDVPVKINIWIRPECQRRQFDIIKKARPSILFVTSDGGRNQEEWDAIYRNRRLYDEEIDWECKVYKLYMDENFGLYEMGKKRNELIWSKVDRCIFLEDDQIPSISFFRFCADLLEKYKDDQRIECICGMNHLGSSPNVQADYFFSRQGSIWGYATWKRIYEGRNNFSYFDDLYIMSLLKQRTKYNPIAWKRLNAYALNKKYEGHMPGQEFWFEFDMYAQNRLQIIPKVNLISNIGATENAVHSNKLSQLPKWLQKVYYMPVYEMKFPMVYTEYVIPDLKYERERNKIMHYNCKGLSDRMAQLKKKILQKDYRYFFDKIREKIKRAKIED